jgi:cob(I)alamin adenosyltransferase
MSIATKGGDAGTTGLAGGLRTSKADLRVEALGTVDELNTFLGFARSICSQEDVAGWTETIQRTLFRVGSALATPPEARKTPPIVTVEDVEFLTQLVYQIEATDGILSDWSLPGADPQSAAYEMARTVGRTSRCSVQRNHGRRRPACDTRGARLPQSPVGSHLALRPVDRGARRQGRAAAYRLESRTQLLPCMVDRCRKVVLQVLTSSTTHALVGSRVPAKVSCA